MVAEGVEEKQQLSHLVDINCDYVQGYYFAKPMPVDEFERFLSNRFKRLSVGRKAFQARNNHTSP